MKRWDLNNEDDLIIFLDQLKVDILKKKKRNDPADISVNIIKTSGSFSDSRIIKPTSRISINIEYNLDYD